MLKVESPCINNCCLDDSDICMGCCRTLDEIKSWTSLTEQQKNVVLKLCYLRQKERKNNMNSFNQG